MTNDSDIRQVHDARPNRAALLAIPLGLVICATLAVTSLLRDSITFDETLHLAAGMSFLKTGDFRMISGTPPLSQMWSAAPLLFADTNWSPPEEPWRGGLTWTIAQSWLFDLNDGRRLMVISRFMVVPLLLATCLAVYIAAKSLFGPKAALLAFALAIFSPEFLAHGHLVTTDMAITLAFVLTLLTFSRLMQRITIPRLIAAAAAVAAMSLIKFSWPVILPALAIMSLVAIFRNRPIESGGTVWYSRPCSGDLTMPAQESRPTRDQRAAGVNSFAQKATAVALIAIFLSVAIWFAIWTCFGWRYTAFAGPDALAARMTALREPGQPDPLDMAAAWETALRDAAGRPISGLTPAFIRWAKARQFLPEAYLFGLTSRIKPTLNRVAYLNGQFSPDGWYSYFLIVFALKTPLPTILLLSAGLAALFWNVIRQASPATDPNPHRRGAGHDHPTPDSQGAGQHHPNPDRKGGASANSESPSPGTPGEGRGEALPRTASISPFRVPHSPFDPLLLSGLLTFAATYTILAIASRINIGQRHLLPIYPAIFILAGASVFWCRARSASLAILALTIWLAISTLITHPNYLGYFNELAGGPQNGHKYVADSNIDWGQDLIRLADYAKRHPSEPLKLAYFGSARPAAYGVACESLPSFLPFPAEKATLTAGTYVISVSQLLGLFEPRIRDDFWTADVVHAYALGRQAMEPPSPNSDPAKARAARLLASDFIEQYEFLRPYRLINRLAKRMPNERIGTSMFVYRLTQSDIDQLLLADLHENRTSGSAHE